MYSHCVNPISILLRGNVVLFILDVALCKHPTNRKAKYSLTLHTGFIEVY